MNKTDIIAFFDRLAPTWDKTLVRSDAVIGAILDAGGVKPGVRVLDVACGTGVLFPDYLARGVSQVVGVDISPEMISVAEEKTRGVPSIRLICGDVETLDFDEKFDCVMIYNAFPHFPEPEKVLERLCGLLENDGRLTVAHGMSRSKIDAHHHGAARHVSVGLMEENALASLMGRRLTVDTVVSDDEKYIVSGYL